MSQKITTLLRDFVISANLVDPEMVQAWDDEGEIDAGRLSLALNNGDTETLSNELSIRLSVDEMPIADVDKLKVVVARFVRFYSSNMTIKFVTEPLDKENCQVMFEFDVKEDMRISQAGGLMAVDYCNAALSP